ncbi:heparinase II/III family protein, partial [bacterium]|nr:heparinase II/III family protein [bacterium]
MRYSTLMLAWLVGVLVACAPAYAGQAAAPQDAYAVIRADQNPLAKGKTGVPAPDIVWEKVAVRADHPRLLFNKETIGELRKRFPEHDMAEVVEKAALSGDPLANAFMYQMGGDKAMAGSAIKSLLAGQTEGWTTAYVFDWTFDAMTEAQRPKAIERAWGQVTRDRASGWPRSSPYTSYPDDSRPSETAPAEWPPFYNWTFHDVDWARRYAPSFMLVVALAGHHPRAAEGVRNYWEYSLKDAQLFLDHLNDGSYWQGCFWSISDRIRNYVIMFQTMKTACGIDYTDPAKHPWLANFGRWLLYCTDIPGRRVAHTYGDGRSVFVGRFSRPKSTLLASNSLAKDPYVAWMLGECMDFQAHWLPEIVFGTPTLIPKSPKALPLGRAFPGTGQAVMRSSWGGGGIWSSVRWCDWFDMHSHGDAGSFILYCNSPLAPDTGHFDLGIHNINYMRRTVAHNTLTIRDPKSAERLNDGSQRVWDRRVWSYAVGTEAWVYNQDYHERGNLLAFETHDLYSYSGGEAANAYPKGTVKEFNRQAVLINDGLFVVFDRVETAKAELEKRWLVHTAGKPAIQGKITKTEVKGHIEEFDGRVHTSKSLSGSIMACHTLLPRDIRMRRVGGAILNIPTADLVAVPRTTQRMGTGSRWLWTDPLIIKY